MERPPVRGCAAIVLPPPETFKQLGFWSNEPPQWFAALSVAIVPFGEH
jgi:hypothetical protein